MKPRPAMCLHLIFDLDGTLVDSAPGILASLTHAFAATGLCPRLPLGTEVIGPPLRETIAHLSDSTDPATIAACVDHFKAHYDDTGVLATRPYAGIPELLAQLAGSGTRLHVATNKRIGPTRKILGQLGWDTLFSSVYGIDTPPGFDAKARLLKALLEREGCAARHSLYIGDKRADYNAAAQHGLDFVGVRWGYASADELAGLPTVADAPALLAYVQRWQGRAGISPHSERNAPL